MGTKVIIVVYQHLFVHFCTFAKGTIGYKRYNLKISIDYQGLFKQKFNYRQKASNTNNLRGART